MRLSVFYGSILLMFGCGQSDHDYSSRSFDPRSDAATKDSLRQALDNVARSEYAIVFVHVDWAPMQVQRTFFNAFVEMYLLKERKPFVNFHYVDFTSVSDNYEPISKLVGWRELELEKGGSLLGGAGEMVWVNRGRVVNVQSTFSFNSVNEVVTKTEKLFAE